MFIYLIFCLSKLRNRHNVEKSTLIITVVRCQGLPARDSNVGSSDPYVKLQLLPDKHHKVKTRVLRRTLNPVYDEDFTFYGIGENQLQVHIRTVLRPSPPITVSAIRDIYWRDCIRR